MKRVIRLEGMFLKRIFDDEYYHVVGFTGASKHARVRIDQWNGKKYSHEPMPELNEFEDKKVTVVITIEEE